MSTKAGRQSAARIPGVRYVPGGGWIFVVRAGLVVGVEPEAAARATAMWEGGAGPAAALDELTRSGISSAPAFVLVSSRPDGSATVMVRGDAVLRVRAASGGLVLDGSGRTTWAEQEVTGFEAAVCVLGDAAGEPLPIVEGVVQAMRLEVGQVATGAPSGPVASGPEAPGPEAAPPVPDGRSPSETGSVSLADVTLVVQTDAIDPPFVGASPDDPGPEAPAEPPAAGYDHLFGATVARSVELAAVRPEPDGGEEDAPSAGIEERTTVAADLESIRARRRATRRAAAATPPSASYWLDLSTGAHERLDQPIVVGRAPSASSVAGEAVPRLVTMTTPNQDISRTHVRIVEHDGTVVVTDLHSRNGTIVTMPGKPPLRLREGEPTVVISGSVIDLGDGATLTVREDG